MNIDSYKVPIIIGVVAENGSGVNDNILEKLITPQLIKIKNTFPNSPFLLLSPLSNEKERLSVRIAVERLDADVIIPSDNSEDETTKEFEKEISEHGLINSALKSVSLESKKKKGKNYTLNPELFTTAESQILIAITGGNPTTSTTENDDETAISKALSLRYQGLLREIYTSDNRDNGVLYTGDVGLTININPETFDIRADVTPEEDDATDIFGESKSQRKFTQKLSFLFNSYIERIIGVFDRLYHSYIEIPDEGEKDRLARTSFVEIAEKIDGYNKDIAKFLQSKGEEQVLKSRSYLLSEESENAIITEDAVLTSVIAPYTGADVLSQFYQKKTNRYINWIYILFFIAVLLYGIIDLNYYLVLFYIALIPAIGFLVYRSKAEKIEDRFLDYRALAEGLRVKVFWHIAGVNESVSSNYLSKYAGLVSWISGAVKNIEALSLSGEHSSKKMTKAEKEERLRTTNKLWIDSQLEYYGRKRSPLYMRSLDLGNLALVSFVLTLFFALVFGIYLIFAGLGNDTVIMRFEVLIGAAAAFGVAAHAYKSKKAFEELERRYKLTQDIYMSAKRKLSRNPQNAESILAALGKEALIENSDWLWTHRNQPIELPKG